MNTTKHRLRPIPCLAVVATLGLLLLGSAPAGAAPAAEATAAPAGEAWCFPYPLTVCCDAAGCWLR